MMLYNILILSSVGTSNFKPRQRADIKKIELKSNSLKTPCTWNGITGYLQLTYVKLKVMSTPTVQWNRACMENGVCISASAAWMSRPVAVDINYTLCSATQHTVHHTVVLITTQSTNFYMKPDTQLQHIFSETAHWNGWSSQCFPTFSPWMKC